MELALKTIIPPTLSSEILVISKTRFSETQAPITFSHKVSFSSNKNLASQPPTNDTQKTEESPLANLISNSGKAG